MECRLGDHRDELPNRGKGRDGRGIPSTRRKWEKRQLATPSVEGPGRADVLKK